MSFDPAPGVRAVKEAAGLVRAYLDDDGAEHDRILAEAPNHVALATALAAMLAQLAFMTDPALIERFLELEQRKLQDSVLDIYLSEDAPSSADSEAPRQP